MTTATQIIEETTQRVERWYREHVDAAYRLALRCCGDADDAQDVVHAAFADLLANDLRPRSAGSERSWLMGVIWNHGLLFKRGAGRRRKREKLAFAAEERPPAGGPEGVVEEAEHIALIRSCLDELPERDRAVLHMHYCEGMSQKEIADSLDAKQGTVGSWISRAAKKLEAIMRRAGLPAALVLVAALRELPAEEAPSTLRTAIEGLLQGDVPLVPTTIAGGLPGGAHARSWALPVAAILFTVLLLLLVLGRGAPVVSPGSAERARPEAPAEPLPLLPWDDIGAELGDMPVGDTGGGSAIDAPLQDAWRLGGSWPYRLGPDARSVLLSGRPDATAREAFEIDQGAKARGWYLRCRLDRRLPVDEHGLHCGVGLRFGDGAHQGGLIRLVLHGDDGRREVLVMRRARADADVQYERQVDERLIDLPASSPALGGRTRIGIIVLPGGLAFEREGQVLAAWSPSFAIRAIEWSLELWMVDSPRENPAEITDLRISRLR